jgi:hypothetical protein
MILIVGINVINAISGEDRVKLSVINKNFIVKQ